jgi:hypothetical protein
MSANGEVWNSGTLDTEAVTKFAHVSHRYSNYIDISTKLETHFATSVTHIDTLLGVAKDVPTLVPPTNNTITPSEFTTVVDDIHVAMKAILHDTHDYSVGQLSAAQLATDLFNEVQIIGTALDQF